MNDQTAIRVAVTLRFGTHIRHCCAFCEHFRSKRVSVFKHKVGARGRCTYEYSLWSAQGVFEGIDNICSVYTLQPHLRECPS